MHALPTDRRARAVAIILLCAAPVACGLLTLALGQDANWDLRNYHWYNAYAFLEGRQDFDRLPAQTPTFYNPTLDVPFFLAANAWPPRVVGFLLGAVQGLNAVLVFALAHALLDVRRPMAKVWACGGLAAAGMIGGGGLAVLGTTFYDNVVSLGVIGALLVVALRHRTIFDGALAPAFATVAAAGLLAGASMGLKQPTVVYCIGLCFAFLFLPVHPLRRLFLSFFFGLGVLAGIAAFSGHWMLYLWETYGNPLFPYMNHVFRSPYAAISDYRHKVFIPESTLEHLLLPLHFAFDPLRVGEIAWRDLRIPLLFVLLPVAALAAFAAGRLGRRVEPVAEPAPARYLLVALALSYAAWAWMFCIYRYLIPAEILAPLAIVLAVGLLPLRRPVRLAGAGALVAAVVATVQPGDWGRIAWEDERWVRVGLPEIPDPDRTMILMGGYQPFSEVIPAFPPQIPFVRIQSNFLQADSVGNGYLGLVRARVAAHDGDFFMLSTIPDTDIAAESAALYGLRLDPGRCQIVTTNLGEPLNFCPVHRPAADGRVLSQASPP